MRYVHPFPARMAPEIATGKLQGLASGSVVLDPMLGSGTVVSAALSSGLSAIGRDVDPLAVLISRVACGEIKPSEVSAVKKALLAQVNAIDRRSVELPWIDNDKRTKEFINYWFGPKQRTALRKFASVLKWGEFDSEIHRDLARVAFSRVIITKGSCASLAMDTSHSRPHKVKETSTYDVFAGIEKSFDKMRTYFERREELYAVPDLSLGDARQMVDIPDGSIDMVMTSPPYLNAIDYMRGHRFSLVWFGLDFKGSSRIRGEAIGAERMLNEELESEHKAVLNAYGDLRNLNSRVRGMISRYCLDLVRLSREVVRVLKPGGSAVFVMGDSNLRGVLLKNSEAMFEAMNGCLASLVSRSEREINSKHRYLPIAESNNHEGIGNRMRREIILEFSVPQ